LYRCDPGLEGIWDDTNYFKYNQETVRIELV
jgi:hypothetical protein